MNIRQITPLAIVGIVMALPVNRCLAQTDEPKENDIRQMQILLRTEGLDVISPERQGAVPTLMQDEMLPPEYKTQKEKSDIRLQWLREAKEKAKSQQNSDTSFFREQLSQQIEFLANQGTDVQKLKELVERLQSMLEKSEKEPTDEIAVAVFAVDGEPQERPDGSPKPTPLTPPHGERPTGERPRFTPLMPMMQGQMLQHAGPGPKMHRPEMHQPAGPFAEDQKRIAALSESAERLAQAGMPDIARSLRERAGQLQKEVAEKQEHLAREERERSMARMREQEEHARRQQERMAEQRRDSAERDDHPALPLRELQEQLEHLRRDVHSINEKISRLTEIIKDHHQAQVRRGHHEEMDDDDDDDDDDEDDKTDDDDREVKQDRDRDEDDDDEDDREDE